jgi:hypothetical protein
MLAAIGVLPCALPSISITSNCSFKLKRKILINDPFYIFLAFSAARGLPALSSSAEAPGLHTLASPLSTARLL